MRASQCRWRTTFPRSRAPVHRAAPGGPPTCVGDQDNTYLKRTVLNAPGSTFISDRYEYQGTYHGATHSHIDALGCHVHYQGEGWANLSHRGHTRSGMPGGEGRRSRHKARRVHARHPDRHRALQGQAVAPSGRRRHLRGHQRLGTMVGRPHPVGRRGLSPHRPLGAAGGAGLPTRAATPAGTPASSRCSISVTSPTSDRITSTTSCRPGSPGRRTSSSRCTRS